MRPFVVTTNAKDNVTTLQRAAETGRAGTYSKTMHVKMQGDRFALYEVERNISILREPLPAMAIEGSVWYLSKDTVNRPPLRRTASLEDIFKAAASYHQLSMDDLLSKRRTKAVVRARQIAMYLAREETEASYPKIGAALGGRNHSTVVYGYRKIAGAVQADETLRLEVDAIRRQLHLFPQS